MNTLYTKCYLKGRGWEICTLQYTEKMKLKQMGHCIANNTFYQKLKQFLAHLYYVCKLIKDNKE